MTTHPTEDLAAHALGILEPEEQRAVDAHLAICRPCRDEERSFAETAWAVAESSERPVPAGLRSAIVSGVRADGASVPRPGWLAGFREALRRPVPLAIPFAMAAVVLVSLFGYGTARRDVDRYAAALSAAAGAKVVALAPTGIRDGVRGSLVVPVNGAAPYLILDLPSAPAGKVWEAWVIRGGIATRAGLTDDRGVLLLPLTAPYASGDTVALTSEPPGGADVPTSAAVLEGKS